MVRAVRTSSMAARSFLFGIPAQRIAASCNVNVVLAINNERTKSTESFTRSMRLATGSSARSKSLSEAVAVGVIVSGILAVSTLL